MNTIQAAGIVTASTEECPLQVMVTEMRGIWEDLADLMVYAQGQIDEAKAKEDKNV